jgi:hypothetical protein
MGPIGPGMVVGILLGGLIGVVVGMVLLGRGKASTGVKAALALPALLGGAVVGVIVGLFVGLLIDLLFIASSPLARMSRESDRYQKLPLRSAACANDLGKVRALLAGPLDEENGRHLGRIIYDCTLSNSVKVPPGDEMLKLMLPVLHARYVAAPARPIPIKEIYADPDYCGVIALVISDLNAAKLRVVQSIGLPLHCREGAAHMLLDRFIGMPHTFEERRAGIDEVLRLIGGRDGPLGQASSESGRSFLDSVVEAHPPPFIIAALEAGADPGRPDPVFGIPAVLRWHTRKFANNKPLPRKIALSDGEIAAVDKLMRPPTAAEFGRLYVDRGPLHYFRDFEQLDDGGAAYFRDLRERGVDLGLITARGYEGRRGMLGHHRSIGPALLAELERLTPAEIERMAFPRDPDTGAPGEPLLQSVKAERNTALVHFLCRRGIRGCTAADREKAVRSQR